MLPPALTALDDWEEVRMAQEIRHLIDEDANDVEKQTTSHQGLRRHGVVSVNPAAPTC